MVQIIENYSNVDAPWVPDVVGRAWGNRGNARSRQGFLEEALSDYNRAIEICPWSGDPVLNRCARACAHACVSRVRVRVHVHVQERAPPHRARTRACMNM